MNIFRFLLLFVLINNSYALLKIDINKQNIKTISIAIANFHNNEITQIVKADLERSGRFKVKDVGFIDKNYNFSKLQSNNVEAVFYGDIKKINNKYRVSFSLHDIWSDKILFSENLISKSFDTRRIAHYLSDRIYLALLGEYGIFSTKIAYISVDDSRKLKYQLEVSDADGVNSQVVFKSKYPLMSPAWSPDNKKLAYVSFKSGHSRVYIQKLYSSGTINKLPIYDGISSSPNWHPNGKSLVFTLSKNGNKDIYRYYLNGKLTRLTKNKAIDTEAVFSPDGKALAWTSNRSGSVQIYYKNLSSNKISKLTSSGSYNANADFSPDGKTLTIVHKEDGKYQIAIFDIASKIITPITDGNLEDSPNFAPNGKFIIFANKRSNKDLLSVVATNNPYSFNLSDGNRLIRDPSWSGNL